MRLLLPIWPIAALAVLLLCSGLATARAQSDETLATCQILVEEQWKALWDENGRAADKLAARARQAGCFNPPTRQQLCPIPAAQELKADLNGNVLIVNQARHQQRFFGCDRPTVPSGPDGGR